MTKLEGSPKLEVGKISARGNSTFDFVIPSTFGFRHSSFLAA
jgi:hypothetical protein